MKQKEKLLLACLIFTSAVLFGFMITYRRFNPLYTKVPLPVGYVPATESNPTYQQREAVWLAKKFDRIPEGSSLAHLEQLIVSPSSPVKDGFDKAALATSADQIVQSLKSKDFQNFFNHRAMG